MGILPTFRPIRWMIAVATLATVTAASAQQTNFIAIQPVPLCQATDAANNTPEVPGLGSSYEDGIQKIHNRIYIAYSMRGDSTVPGTYPDNVKNNVGIFVFNRGNRNVLIFGTGYGDPGGGQPPLTNTALRSGQFDANAVDHIIRSCFKYHNRSTINVDILVPHGHYDHINGPFMTAFDGLGYTINNIYIHENDRAAVLPPGDPVLGEVDEETAFDHLYTGIGNSDGYPGTINNCPGIPPPPLDGCTDHVIDLTTTNGLGTLWARLNPRHTCGALDLYIPLPNNSTKAFLFRGSGSTHCPLPNPTIDIEIFPHGNVILP